MGVIKTTTSIFLICFLLMSSVDAQESENSSNFAIGMNLGLQKPFCDVIHTGAGLAGEFMVKFLLNDRFNLSGALGYGILNDGFSNNTFETNLITGDLKANVNLLGPGKFNPYVFAGVGLFSFSYDRTSPGAIGNPGLVGERYFDGSFLFGGGAEYMVSPKLAINAFADYRHTTGDDIDGAAIGSSKDGYLNARLGFTYYMGARSTESMSEEDDLLALERVESEELDETLLFGEDEFSTEGDDKLAMFEAKLDKLDASETEMSMEQYVRLKSRIDELSGLIENKEQELEELRTSLDFKDQRIVNLEQELQQSSGGYVPSSSAAVYDNFTSNYENALRSYYAKDYQSAINMFTDLKNSFPHHKLSSNCQYWIGECYFGLADYFRAAEAFQSVFDFGLSYKKDDATLMLGRCYFNLQDISRAKSYFQGLINEYPDSEYIEKAQQWLSRIS